jgi:hypothetical protein
VLIPAGIALVGVYAWIAGRGEKDIAFEHYRKATCIASSVYQGTRSWNATLRLPGGVSVRVTAEAWVSGRFELAFSNETGTRSVTRTRDYVYPHDARYEPATQTLWLIVSGHGGGVFPEARVYQYDLNSRTIRGEWDVSPDDVSDECPVSQASRSGRNRLSMLHSGIGR